ncbi:MAG TPA: valine--tRNA ligase [Candidatus Saccharimonadales bacterium]|nr:valine--tRNA ligase [Candidatus Saccharimonadales bacterium]
MKLPHVYEPGKYEADIYLLWERNEAFRPANRGGEGHFSVVFPPPNANGDLHMGHALTTAIQDSLVRYNRMTGQPTIFVPGADHAGFETWVVYERKLNEQGKSRFDFTREELYKQVWDFVQANRHNFEAQLRALGASFDWGQFTFTLDGKVVKSSYSLFKKMWDEGLIYRGLRIVNFCTFHGTSFSDIEVIHEDEDSRLWHIAYPLSDGSGEVVVATTRPETMLGDTAVAVNPDDDRYKSVVGKTIKLPLSKREIPIVADKMVDPQFGSGAVKVTPAHDPNDFEVAGRHNLPLIEVITTEGKIGPKAPKPFRGLTVSQARSAVEKALEEQGFMRGSEPYRHAVGKCYKCGTVIEPLPRQQWFVKMRSLAEKAERYLNHDQIKFYPASKKKQVLNYLAEVKDWNISRQIAWGIPIPAFVNTKDENDWIFDERVNKQTIKVDGVTYRRDPDVFDTWFSSGQWPFVTLDYPDGPAFKQFYPLSLMETGGEILYQWVARMIMLGLYVTDEVPFKNVYIHGYVLAEDGAKMSKSLGNVINPLDIIGEFGSDALRMGLLTGRRPGINQGYHPAKIKGGRNFANKLWNIARYTEDKVGDVPEFQPSLTANTLAEHWILARAGETARAVGQALENYRLSEAYEHVYEYIWHDLADWYIEVSKTEPNPALLAGVLQLSLKLVHPFAPFISETIWQTLAWTRDSLLAIQRWPAQADHDPAKASQFQDLVEIISEIRRINAAMGVKAPALYFRDSELIKGNAGLIQRLAGVSAVQESGVPKSFGIRINKVGFDCWLNVDTATTQAYLDKLIDQRLVHQKNIDNLQARLNNQGYLKQAPAEVVNQSREGLQKEQALLSQIQSEIDNFSNLAGS